MTSQTHPDLDELRRKIIANHDECKRLGEIALATPAFAAYSAAKAAYEESDEAKAHHAALEREGELDEETPGGFHQNCELCGCPLFDDGKKITETWSLGEDGPTGCMGAAREDEALDCPGKRLGLIGDGK